MTKTRCREALSGQLLAGVGPALHAQGHQAGVLGNLPPDGRRLPLQGRVDLGPGGILGQALLGQFGELQPAIGPQALLIFGAGGQIEFLFQLAHTDEMYAQHRLPPFSPAAASRRSRR